MRPTPFLLSPAWRDYLWGGTRLRTGWGKAIEATPLAETWECSTHPAGESCAASGPFAGQPLSRILKAQPAWRGTAAAMLPAGELPVLIKLIDAAKDLAIQVHPDDAYAAAHEGGQRGKTELWQVLEAAPGAFVWYGFRHGTSAEAVRAAIAAGTPETLLNRIPVRAGDSFLVEAGTVHAIGAGCLIAEIQQCSDLTYRLWDFNRRDADGNLRELHIDKAMAVLDFTATATPLQTPDARCMCAGPHFAARRLPGESPAVVDDRSFAVLLCTAGEGRLDFAGGSLSIRRGECVFVPAGTGTLALRGTAELTDVRLPR